MTILWTLVCLAVLVGACMAAVHRFHILPNQREVHQQALAERDYQLARLRAAQHELSQLQIERVRIAAERRRLQAGRGA